MEGISDIKIIGMDEKRPPRLRKEPYIDLYFVLSHQAVAGWCKEFNQIAAKYLYPAKIDEKQGLYIETWVRTMDEIAPQLNTLKETVQTCIAQYIAKISVAATTGQANPGGESTEQMKLNAVISGLKFN